jgi:DNA-binding beta-propeller fold protein YncE
LRREWLAPTRFGRYGLLLLACVLAMAHRIDAQAPLLPTGIAYDSAGNLYFADTNRHQVFESSLSGKLTVVAGSGVQGYGGDGGAAGNALLDSPLSVAVGLDGTLYIADTGNQRIREQASLALAVILELRPLRFSTDQMGLPSISAEPCWFVTVRTSAFGALAAGLSRPSSEVVCRAFLAMAVLQRLLRLIHLQGSLLVQMDEYLFRTRTTIACVWSLRLE